ADDADEARFILYSGECAAWCALLEVGAGAVSKEPLRVGATRLAALEPAAVEESATRLVRLALLERRPLLVDASGADSTIEVDAALRALFAIIARAGARAGVVCTEPARVVRLLGSAQFTLVDQGAIRPSTRLANVK